MTPVLLPDSADRTEVTLEVFDKVSQQKYVLPLAAQGGEGALGGTFGEVTLVAGVATVPLTAVTANSAIMLTRRAAGGTPGHLGFTRSAGVGFSITNTSNVDTSVIQWQLIGDV